MRELDPGASGLAYFGSELRRYRLNAGMSQPELGQACHASGSLIGMYERAKRVPDPAFLKLADAAFGVDVFAHMWRLISKEAHPVYFQQFAGVEASATQLREFEPLAIPGLLQTGDYARALLAHLPDTSAEEVEELVAARMERQAILDRDDPPTLVVLLHEPLLSCPMGGREVMRSQLDVLLEAAKRLKVIVQIVPTSSTTAAGLAGAFTIASMDGHELVYFETATTGHLVDRADDVAACVALFEALRAEALSQEASLELIRNRKDEYEL